MKKIVAIVMVICISMVIPTNGAMKTHWMRASGTYFFTGMYTGKGQILAIKWSHLSKKQKKEALRLFKNDPRELYRKYRKKIPLDRIIKAKIKGNTLTIWGKFNYVGNGIKKKYKFGKYKFKLSRNAVMTNLSEDGSLTHRGAKMKKDLLYTMGAVYKCYVSGGKIYKFTACS